MLWGGDWNVVTSTDDLQWSAKNWDINPGARVEEREGHDKLLREVGMVDAWRWKNKTKKEFSCAISSSQTQRCKHKLTVWRSQAHQCAVRRVADRRLHRVREARTEDLVGPDQASCVQGVPQRVRPLAERDRLGGRAVIPSDAELPFSLTSSLRSMLIPMTLCECSDLFCIASICFESTSAPTPAASAARRTPWPGRRSAGSGSGS